MTRAEAPPMAPASCVSELDEVRVGAQLVDRGEAAAAREGEEGLARPLRPEEAPDERQEILDRGAAAPDGRALEALGVAEDVDEEGGLARLRDARPARDRDAHVGPDVGEHAPEERVRDLVEPGEPEELLRPEQRDPEQSVREEAGGQPPRLREGREHERVRPHREAGRQPGDGSRPRRPLPVDPAEDGRRELRHRRERDEADRDERVRLARGAEVDVPEQEDDRDGEAPDGEEQPRHVLPLVDPQRPQPQEHRHHEVVADHRREGDRLDDHHPGAGREPADEGEERERLLVLSHRQRQDEGVRVHAAACEVQEPAQRDRQDEDVDEEEVEREEPDRLAEVVLVHVLDDRDLELPRQEHDGEHREERHERPGAVAATAALDGEESLEPRRRAREGEDLAEPVVEAERDERAHRQEGEELHDRLEGDRRDEALVPLGRVEVARAEEDGERGERQRDVERAVLDDRQGHGLGRHHDVRVLQEDGEAARDRLQLERDVRDDADDRDDRHEPAQRLALAVAGGDEVGDRGDAVRLADADDLPPDVPPQPHHERRPQVHRQEADAARGGAPHAAVEGPGRAVDREREGVDVRVRDDGATGLGPPVAPVRDREQHAQVGERDEDDDPSLEHRYSRGRSTASAMSAMRSVHEPNA